MVFAIIFAIIFEVIFAIIFEVIFAIICNPFCHDGDWWSGALIGTGHRDSTSTLAILGSDGYSARSVSFRASHFRRICLPCLFVLVHVGYFPPVSGPGFESREMNLARHLLSRLGKPANHISINGGKSRKRSERARQTPTKHHKHDKHRQQTTNKPPKTTSLRPLFPLFFCPNHRIASPPPVLIV